MLYSTHRDDDISNSRNKDEFQLKFGSIWEAQLKASDERIKRLERVIRVLEEKVPSHAMIKNKQLGDAVKNFTRWPPVMRKKRASLVGFAQGVRHKTA
jgi:hypothetical protein